MLISLPRDKIFSWRLCPEKAAVRMMPDMNRSFFDASSSNFLLNKLFKFQILPKSFMPFIVLFFIDKSKMMDKDRPEIRETLIYQKSEKGKYSRAEAKQDSKWSN
jgi:hypothetical protein